MTKMKWPTKKTLDTCNISFRNIGTDFFYFNSCHVFEQQNNYILITHHIITYHHFMQM